MKTFAVVMVWAALTGAAESEPVHYEATTPDYDGSAALRALAEARQGMARNAADARDTPVDAATAAVHAALEGRGDVVIMGLEDGMVLVQDFGGRGVNHLLDTVRTLPRKGDDNAIDGIVTAEEIAVARDRAVADTREDRAHTRSRVQRNNARFTDTRDATVAQMARSRREHAAATNAEVGSSVGAAQARAAALGTWSGQQRSLAWTGLTQGTRDDVKGTIANTASAAAFWRGETVHAFHSVGDAPARTWALTREATSGSFQQVLPEGLRILRLSTTQARSFASWLNTQRATPFVEGMRGIKQLTDYNWDRGWVNGARAGMQSASTAWQHDDHPVAVLWVSSGLGKGALHLLLLQPTTVSFFFTSILGVAAAMHAVGYPLLGAMFTGGAALAAGALLTGVMATGTMFLAGSALTALAAGAGLGRAVGVALLGVVVTGAMAVGNTAATAARFAGHAGWLVVAPALGFMGQVGALTLGGVQAVHAVAWHTAAVVGGTALGMARLTEVGALGAVDNALSIARASLLATALHTVVVPVQSIALSAGWAARSVGRLVEDPLVGVSQLLFAGVLLMHTTAGAGLLFGMELVGGAMRGLGHLVAMGGHGAMAMLATMGVVSEFVGRAINIPQHRAWAEFRGPETEQALAQMQAHGAPSDVGSIILMRTHWWGEDTGRVRFFITRNEKTGARWYFERRVDEETCEVVYRGTTDDPWVRAVRDDAWKGTWRTGLIHRGCVEQRP